MSRFLYENHWGSPTLTLLNVLGVLNVLNMLNALNVLNVLNVLYVLYMPMDASLACRALLCQCLPDSSVSRTRSIHGDQPQLWDFITMLCLNGDT